MPHKNVSTKQSLLYFVIFEGFVNKEGHTSERYLLVIVSVVFHEDHLFSITDSLFYTWLLGNNGLIFFYKIAFAMSKSNSALLIFSGRENTVFLLLL